jgi:nicotinamidase-related amidase
MNNYALILIDIQNGFDDPQWGKRNNHFAESNARRLLDRFRELKNLVVHIRHDATEKDSPLRPGFTGNNFKDIVSPIEGERIFSKTVNSAFIGTSLDEYLVENGISYVIIAGLTTPHCISTSSRMASNLGFKVVVVSDATAAFSITAHDGTILLPEDVHFHALASLNDEFALIKCTDDVLFEFSH